MSEKHSYHIKWAGARTRWRRATPITCRWWTWRCHLFLFRTNHHASHYSELLLIQTWLVMCFVIAPFIALQLLSVVILQFLFIARYSMGVQGFIDSMDPIIEQKYIEINDVFIGSFIASIDNEDVVQYIQLTWQRQNHRETERTNSQHYCFSNGCIANKNKYYSKFLRLFENASIFIL